MSIRVEFHNHDAEGDIVLYLDQVPRLGEHVYLGAASERPQRVRRVVWNYEHLDSPSAHINQVRADVYLEPDRG